MDLVDHVKLAGGHRQAAADGVQSVETHSGQNRQTDSGACVPLRHQVGHAQRIDVPGQLRLLIAAGAAGFHDRGELGVVFEAAIVAAGPMIQHDAGGLEIGAKHEGAVFFKEMRPRATAAAATKDGDFCAGERVLGNTFSRGLGHFLEPVKKLACRSDVLAAIDDQSHPGKLLPLDRKHPKRDLALRNRQQLIERHPQLLLHLSKRLLRRGVSIAHQRPHLRVGKHPSGAGLQEPLDGLRHVGHADVDQSLLRQYLRRSRPRRQHITSANQPQGNRQTNPTLDEFPTRKRGVTRRVSEGRIRQFRAYTLGYHVGFYLCLSTTSLP